MGLMSSKIEREKLRPGDHIYTWRNCYSYSHHGIYVGDGKVIHVARGPGLLIFSTCRSQPSNDCVVCCSIDDFLCDGELYRFEYGVSKLVFLIKRAGTCSFASSKPPEDVLHRASYLVEHGFGYYDLWDKNCEDFALYCKTGFLKGNKYSNGSEQISSLVAAFGAVILVPYRFLPFSFSVLALVGYGCYCFLRLRPDVGSQSDCAVVAVEEINNVRREDMTEKGTRWSLGPGQYFAYAMFAIKIWYWTPESIILVWLKSAFLYIFLICVVSEHLRLHGFKLGEYSAYTIWVLVYLYCKWRSMCTILVWTRLLFLFSFLVCLISYQPDHPRRFKLNAYVANTILAFEVWFWTPGITILQWIKLAFLYSFIPTVVPDQLRNHRLMCRCFRACFLIQSAALILGLDYNDYIFRITKKITFL